MCLLSIDFFAAFILKCVFFHFDGEYAGGRRGKRYLSQLSIENVVFQACCFVCFLFCFVCLPLIAAFDLNFEISILFCFCFFVFVLLFVILRSDTLATTSILLQLGLR